MSAFLKRFDILDHQSEFTRPVSLVATTAVARARRLSKDLPRPVKRHFPGHASPRRR
jgi:hypothetical protein